MNDPRRALLWIGFLVFAVINTIANTMGGMGQVVGLIAGVVCLGFIAALIIHHYTGRRP
ncbi:hypothetical protein ACIBKY_17770 [Nonomuraea sp. NPDC050394]|uniref:hypothetical protein n=1 Tax=Nonomuraea sp. NPDC050394 TaxID=3364363 RepID=UPI0037BCDF03